MNTSFLDIGLSKFIRDFSLSLPRLDALREGIDLYGATRFSPFMIFEPNENALSRVVAELFDPLGSHGQGLLFLNALLASIKFPRLNRLDAVKIRREAMTRARRRIDIVIETAQYVIGIENKPWAAQQPGQLADYQGELAADLRGRQPILIFLSDQEEESGEGIVKIPYFDAGKNLSLHRLLSSVVDEIKALGPREFVADFIRYIEVNFGTGNSMDQANKPYRDAVDAEFDDASKRKAIASILLSQEMLHLRVMREIGEYILSEVRTKASPDFEVASDKALDDVNLGACLYDKWTPWGVRRPSWPTNCLVAVESQKYFFLDIQFGVKAPDPKKMVGAEEAYGCPARKKLSRLMTDIPGGRKTNYWPWTRALDEPYWGQEFAARLIIESPTARVDTHPEIQDLAREFVETAIVVDRLLIE